MRATMAQLEALYWTARLGTVRAAANHLHVTQPSLSLRIRGLEAKFEVSLLERVGRKIRLTAAGAELVGYAERMISLGAEMEECLRVPSSRHERLRLGVTDSFALTCLPKMLDLLDQYYDNILVELTIDHSVNLQRHLHEEALDLALLIDPAPLPRLSMEPFCEVKSIWVANANSPMKGRVLQPKDLANEQIVTIPDQTSLNVEIKRWFSDAGVTATRLSTCSSMSFLIRLAMHGFGITLLPKAIIQEELRNGALAELQVIPSIPSNTLFAAYPNDRIGRGIHAVIGLARDVLAEHKYFD